MPPAGLSADELAAWLRLMDAPGVGREGARRLLAALGPPQAVLAASAAALSAVVGAVAAQGVQAAARAAPPQWDLVQAWLAGAASRRVMVLGEPDYPAAWLHTADPPLLLYLDGDASLLQARAVALVGSRRPTAQGRDHALRFAEALAAQGWTVVSGLAAGIDGAAHEGALRPGPPGGRTVAIVGTGLDQVYPRAHTALARRIVAEGGLMVSELPLGAPPLAAHFPQRNRLIAGLSRGTVVVEAALRSGSLITARLAGEAGREVMAVPGSVLSAQSVGCHVLIRQGATLVTGVDDILEALTGFVPPEPAADLGPVGEAAVAPPQGLVAQTPTDAVDPVLDVMGHDPVSLDALIARCGWPAPALSAHLLTLELADQVARLPGGLYQRRRGT